MKWVGFCALLLSCLHVNVQSLIDFISAIYIIIILHAKHCYTKHFQSCVIINSIFPFQVPEGNETLSVRLISASGDGRLATGVQIQASLIVLHNDDPVSFAQSVVVAEEGESADFTINRGGQANGR